MKRNVLKWSVKVSMDSISLGRWGTEFHKWGARKKRLHSPISFYILFFISKVRSSENQRHQGGRYFRISSQIGFKHLQTIMQVSYILFLTGNGQPVQFAPSLCCCAELVFPYNQPDCIILNFWRLKLFIWYVGIFTNRAIL